MTHGPPVGHGDLTRTGVRAGCVDLLDTVQERVKPKYHVFGHIHEGKADECASVVRVICMCMRIQLMYVSFCHEVIMYHTHTHTQHTHTHTHIHTHAYCSVLDC